MYGYGAGYQTSHYMHQQAYWEMGGDFRGTFKGTYEWYAKASIEKWRGMGTTIGGIGGGWGGAVYGAKLGAMAGGLAGPIGAGIGTVLGFIGGGLLGGWAGAEGAGAVGGWGAGVVSDIRYAARNAVGGYGNLKFRMPFVNTRAAHTMRQAGLQSMMSSTNNYRTILGREANYLH